MASLSRCVAFICSGVVAFAFPAIEAVQPLVLLQTKAGKVERALEFQEGDKKNLLMIAHHKTGMVLALQAAECVNASTVNISAFKRPARFNNEDTPEGMAMVHFVRDLHELTLSAYMYHKLSSREPMHIASGTAMRAKWTIIRRYDNVSKDEMGWYETDEEESYQHWLGRVPTEVGLRAQLGQLIPQFETMQVTASYCANHTGLCIQRDLHDFTASSESFDKTWREIFNFVGVDMDAHEDLKECIGKLDENNPNFEAAEEGPRLTEHVTSTKLTPEEHEEMLRKIKEIDSQYYNDMLITDYKLN